MATTARGYDGPWLYRSDTVYVQTINCVKAK